jgi:hypothetical protein
MYQGAHSFRALRARAPFQILTGSVNLSHMSELPNILLENLAMYTHYALVNETREQRVHESEGILDSLVVILVHVQEDLLTVARRINGPAKNMFAQRTVHLGEDGLTS